MKIIRALRVSLGYALLGLAILIEMLAEVVAGQDMP